MYAQECPTRAAPSTSFSGNRTKRSLEDGGMDCELPQEGASGQAEMETEGEHKKSRTTAESGKFNYRQLCSIRTCVIRIFV